MGVNLTLTYTAAFVFFNAHWRFHTVRKGKREQVYGDVFHSLVKKKRGEEVTVTASVLQQNEHFPWKIRAALYKSRKKRNNCWTKKVLHAKNFKKKKHWKVLCEFVTHIELMSLKWLLSLQYQRCIAPETFLQIQLSFFFSKWFLHSQIKYVISCVCVSVCVLYTSSKKLRSEGGYA